MDLQDVHTEVAMEAQERLGIIASEEQVRVVADAFEEIAEYFQALAICHLLEFADIDQFRVNLVRSGHARRFFLRKSSEQENTEDYHLALSRSGGFLDAVAAGDLALASDVARFSIQRWEPTWEYEDDYCYYRFLHTVVPLLASGETELPVAVLKPLLDQFEAALEGGYAARYEVCRALLARDDEAFSEGLEMLMAEKQAADDERREVVESYEFTFWPRSFVSVEGLALLRVADLAGLATEEGWALCPQVGRLPVRDTDVVDLFEEIERRR